MHLFESRTHDEAGAKLDCLMLCRLVGRWSDPAELEVVQLKASNLSEYKAMSRFCDTHFSYFAAEFLYIA